MFRLMIDGYTVCTSDDARLLVERAESIRHTIGKAFSVCVWSSAEWRYVYEVHGIL